MAQDFSAASGFGISGSVAHAMACDCAWQAMRPCERVAVRVSGSSPRDPPAPAIPLR